jgi:hypothetical protein
VLNDVAAWCSNVGTLPGEESRVSSGEAESHMPPGTLVQALPSDTGVEGLRSDHQPASKLTLPAGSESPTHHVFASEVF